MTDNVSGEQGEQANGATGAELLPRFLARVIDGFLVTFVMFLVIFPILFVTILGAASGSFGFFGGSGLWSIMGATAGAVLYIGYFAFMESTRGQTVGKMVMKLKTQGPDGQNPSLEVALKRNAYYALNIVPLFGGLLQFVAALYIAYTINDSDDHVGWHDEFAGGSKVVKIG